MVASAQVQRNSESERATGSEWRSVAGCFAERKQKRPKQFVAASAFCFYPGGDLRSHTVARAVSSALRGLTSVFGMGTGVTPAV
jgi:hypothetical protein